MTKAIRKPFNQSRESKRYVIDGKEIRDSRSIATLLFIVRGEGDNREVLCVKRGPSVKGTGRWAIPCGYLNWDESIYESACREAYEETGIEISPKEVTLISVFDQYKTKTQNVVLCFYTKYEGTDYEIPENIQEFSLNEVSEVKWVKINGEDGMKLPSETKRLLKIVDNMEKSNN